VRTWPPAADRAPSRTRPLPNGAWAWPANRRILYNRASAAPDGTPWSERKKFVWWDEDAGKWTGKDVPDFPTDRAPAARSDQAYGGPAHLDGDDPFIMQADGKGWLFAPSGMVDGPMPTHYEPQESGVPNPLYPQQNSPNRMVMRRGDNLSAPGAGFPGSEVYPYVFTTYRLTEHHTAGGMSRWLPVPVRAAAGDVLRDLPGTRRRGGARTLRLGDADLPASGDRGPGARDPADDSADDRREDGSTRSVCPTTGVSAAPEP
jgi:hypothetical protein